MGSTSVCCPTCKAAGMSSTLDPVGVEKGKLNFSSQVEWTCMMV